jgi:hypothetical protein
MKECKSIEATNNGEMRTRQESKVDRLARMSNPKGGRIDRSRILQLPAVMKEYRPIEVPYKLKRQTRRESKVEIPVRM